MSRQNEYPEKLFSGASSIGSEKDLDSLRDLQSPTSPRNSSNMSWPGGDNSAKNDDPLHLRPGSGLPPHHRTNSDNRPPKPRKKDSKVSWSIDVTDSNNPAADRWEREVDPLPEPQTDVPVFSLASSSEHLPTSTLDSNISETDRHDPTSYDQTTTTSYKDRKHKSRDKKKRRSHRGSSTRSSSVENGRGHVGIPAAVYAYDTAQHFSHYSDKKVEPDATSSSHVTPTISISPSKAAEVDSVERQFLARTRHESVASATSLGDSKNESGMGKSLDDSFNDLSVIKPPPCGHRKKRQESTYLIPVSYIK